MLVKIRYEYVINNCIYIVFRIGDSIHGHDDGSLCVRIGDGYGLYRSIHYSNEDIFHVPKEKIDIYPYHASDPLRNIQKKLEDLIFRTVTQLTIKICDIQYARRFKQQIKLPNNLMLENYMNFSEGISSCEMTQIPDQIPDKYKGMAQELYFDNNSRAHYSLYGNNIGRWVPEIKLLEPKKNALLCGIMDVTNMSYKYWFECSQQFYLLYMLIMFGRKHSVFEEHIEQPFGISGMSNSGSQILFDDGDNKRYKNKNQIMDMLETNRENRTIGKKIVQNQYEPSYQYSDIYKAIADLFVFQDGINTKYRKINYSGLPIGGELFKSMLLDAFN